MVFLQSGNQLSMNIGVLLIIIVVAMGAGYLLKLFIEQFLLTPKDTKDNKAEYQYHIELLQNKFSAEIIRKDEDLKVMQDELKASEQKNFNLQVQYAKSLKQIEKSKHTATSPSPSMNGEEHVNEHNHAMAEELNKLQIKYDLQVKEMDTLQAKLQEKEDSIFKLTHEKINSEEKVLIQSLQQKTEILAREKEEAANQLGAAQKEKHAMQDQLFQKVKLYTSKLSELETQVSDVKAEADKQLQQHEQTKQELEQQLADLRNREQEILATQKPPELQDIQTIRTEVEQVTSVINNFKQHLNSALENSYPYEQLLADAEEMKVKLQAADEEKKQFEQVKKDEIKQLTEQFRELENKFYRQEHEMKTIQQIIEQLEHEKQEAVTSVTNLIKEKEAVLTESETLRNKLQQSIELLRKELHEKDTHLNELLQKENKYREMLYTVKDLENQFSRLYPQLDILEKQKESVLNTNGEMR
jgi:chromosome segregation ATPase